MNRPEKIAVAVATGVTAVVIAAAIVFVVWLDGQLSQPRLDSPSNVVPYSRLPGRRYAIALWIEH